MPNSNASSNKSKLSAATTPATNVNGENSPAQNVPNPNASGLVPLHTKSGVLDRRLGVDRRDLKAAKAQAGGEANSDREANSGREANSDREANAGREANATGADANTFVDATTGLERRRGPGRRLSDFTRRAEEGELTKEQFLFLMAIESFKKANDRPYPTWTDVLEVVRLLGYRKTMSMEMKLRNAEDWRETADAPANVRPEKWHLRAA